MFWIVTGLSIVTILIYIYRDDIGGGLGGASSELWKTISNKARYSSNHIDVSDSDVSPIQWHPPIPAQNMNTSEAKTTASTTAAVAEPLSPGLKAEAKNKKQKLRSY